MSTLRRTCRHPTSVRRGDPAASVAFHPERVHARRGGGRIRTRPANADPDTRARSAGHGNPPCVTHSTPALPASTSPAMPGPLSCDLGRYGSRTGPVSITACKARVRGVRAAAVSVARSRPDTPSRTAGCDVHTRRPAWPRVPPSNRHRQLPSLPLRATCDTLHVPSRRYNV
jgi:hypothetical protein